MHRNNYLPGPLFCSSVLIAHLWGPDWVWPFPPASSLGMSGLDPSPSSPDSFSGLVCDSAETKHIFTRCTWVKVSQPSSRSGSPLTFLSTEQFPSPASSCSVWACQSGFWNVWTAWHCYQLQRTAHWTVSGTRTKSDKHCLLELYALLVLWLTS